MERGGLGAMLMRSFLLAGLVLISSSALAVRTATVTVPGAGNYYYWFEYEDADGASVTTTPVGFTDKKTTVELPLVKDAVPESKLFVLDAPSGNEAILAVEPEPEDDLEFSLKASSFDTVRRIEIIITSSSKNLPAAAARVGLKAGEKTFETQMLDPSAAGAVEFRDVPAGTVTVTVKYDGKTKTEDIDVPLERDDPVPTVEIPVLGDIATVAPKVDTEAETASGDTKTRRPGAGINFPMALVGLVLLAIILYAAYRMMRNRGAGLRQIAGKLGVDIPDEPQPSGAAQPAPSAPADPTVCPFCGGKKDPATGACSCTVGGATAAPAPAAGSGPRLVAVQGPHMGGIFQLGGDVVTIGREESNTIALPQDNTVSRRHARVTKSDAGFSIHDEGSSNGTFVNGVRVTEQALNPGDEIQVGGTRLRFET